MVRYRTKSTVPTDPQPELHASSSNAPSDPILSERDALIQDRRTELGRIFSRHDSLIREQFMLENYGLMLFYDPDVAKQDQTNEFLQFKNRHDLMRFMPGAGPSRATRRAQTDRISELSKVAGQFISTPIPSMSSGSATKPNGLTSRGSIIAKGKQKQSVSVAATEVTNDNRVSAKAWGKRKATETNSEQGGIRDDGSMDSISSQRIRSKLRERPEAPSGLNRDSNRRSRSQSVLTDESSSIRLPSRTPHRPLRDERTSSFDVMPPAKKRRLADDEDTVRHRLRITLQPPSARPSAPPQVERPTTSGKSLPGKTLPSNVIARPTIRRIKLIVRPPARTYSSPRQRPDPAVFGYCLPKLLASYIEIDGKCYTPEGLETAARRDARILNRLDELKRLGRYPDQKVVDADTSPKYQQADAWSLVISEAISARQSLSRHRFGYGGALAASIHSKLNTHWDHMKKDMEREHVQEERRLRTLAKSMLKLVVAEWKRAVFHVREQQRLAFEAEEARRGKQHLDAILDQSGQILEKQQLELVRSDSSSVDSDEDEDEEEHDLDGETELEGSDGGEDIEASEAATDVEKDDDDGALVTLQRKRHVEFQVPLNDVGVGTDKLLMGMAPRKTFAGAVYADEDEESRSPNVVETPASSFDAPEPGDEMVVDNDVGTPMDVDDHEQPLPGTDSISSKGSRESSFMQGLLPSDPGPNPDSEGNPEMGNDLEHESIMVSGQPFTEIWLDSDAMPSKHPVLPLQPVAQSEEDASTTHFPRGSPPDPISEPKLPNGSPGHVYYGDSAADDTTSNIIRSDTGEASSKVTVSPSGQTIGDTEASMVLDKATLPEASETDQREARPQQVLEGKLEEQETTDADSDHESESESEWEAPPELQPYAVARVKWEPGSKVLPPLLLRGTLRPYQQSGLEWLASLYNNETNGILADEMGLGKTIQTIALLAHLACDRGIWGPHLIIVPTSVLLNWEMEFKKFLPGFNILSYHGSTKRRKELRRGWNDKYAFNVCITSYTLASRDQHIFKRKAWYYMILDEAHMIKNFKSQRWNILLMFRSNRRLLLTGTPLQNNLTELWALLKFLMSGTNFANQKEFSEWFGIPLEKAIELGNLQDQEVQDQVTKLHEMLRPFLLRRMKKDVEKELPKKYEHLILCRLSKRQRFLYDEFMSRRQTREDLQSGVYQKVANILMQLRKVCNHPDLFEVRPVVTSFAMEKSAIADFEIKEMLIRRRFIEEEDQSSQVNLDALGLQFAHLCNTSRAAAQSTRILEESLAAELIAASPGEPPPRDLRTIEGYRKYNAYQHRLSTYLRYQQMIYINRLRCNRQVLYGLETINLVRRMYNPLTTACEADFMSECRPANHLVKPYLRRAEEMTDLVEKFAFATPVAVARDMPEIALRELPCDAIESLPADFDSVLHEPAVRLQIAFPDLSLLQYDCGKLQELDRLLRERKSGGHRVLIFTQMTRILDILEMFLNFRGYLYLRLDGATKIEDRQYITERFNADSRVFAFIASSRSGGVGINLTGADTVIFYDSDFNPQMDKQCEDRAHRIGQIRDVHIYRFISQYTVEEAMLRKANQKRSLDDIVITKGDFDWKSFFRSAEPSSPSSPISATPTANPVINSTLASMKASALQKALVEFEDFEDAEAAKVAAREEAELLGEDRAEFGLIDGESEGNGPEGSVPPETPTTAGAVSFAPMTPADEDVDTEGLGVARAETEDLDGEEEEEGGTTVDYMIKFVRSDFEYFKEWRLP